MLRPGDDFPVHDVALVDGDTLRLPKGLHNEWTVLLYYRGHW